jgi:hypothetical protein
VPDHQQRAIDNWGTSLLPSMKALTADEQAAASFAIGVLSAHAGDTRLDVQVRNTFGDHAARLQSLLDRARL